MYIKSDKKNGDNVGIVNYLPLKISENDENCGKMSGKMHSIYGVLEMA